MMRLSKLTQSAIGSTARHAEYHMLTLQGLSATDIRIMIEHKNRKVENPARANVQGVEKLVEKFTSQLRLSDLKSIILETSLERPLDSASTRKVVDGVLKRRQVEAVKTLRSLLATQSFSRALQLDQRLLSDMIKLCVELGDVGEALQWMMLAEELLSLELSEEIHNLMLKAAATERSWDLVHFLHEERRTQGFVLNAELTAILITEASNDPFMRWRVVRQLLCERYGASNTPSPETLALGFQTLVNAQQHAQAEALYRELASMVSSTPNCALFAPTLFLPITQSAIRLKKFNLLGDMLVNHMGYVRATTSSQRPRVRSQSLCAKDVRYGTGNAVDEAKWLCAFVSELLGVCGDAPVRAGPVVGCAISWLLRYGDTGEFVVAIWNDFVTSLRAYTEASLVDETICVQDALDDALHTVCSHGCALGASAAQLRASTNFLKAVLLSENHNIPEHNICCYSGVEPVLMPLRSTSLLQSLITLFTQTQELDAVSTMLSKTLEKGNLVDEISMVSVLQLFQKNGDHDLVLELFDMYLRITNPRNNPKKVSIKGRTITLPGKAKFSATHEAISWTFAPHIFRVAMTSYAAKEDFAAMVNLLTEVLPSRGYLPREGFYGFALGILGERGMHSEVASLYAHSQQIYGSQLDISRLSKKTIAQGYGVGSLALVNRTLQSCAKARLGVTALEVFSSLESAHKRSLNRVRPSDFTRMAQLVVTALSTPDYIAFIPQFMRSLRDLTTSPMLTNELLRVALSSTIEMQNSEVTAEIIELIETVNTTARDAIGVKQIVNDVKSSLSGEGAAAVAKFVESCEPLRRLHNEA